MIAIRADNEILDIFPDTKILVTKQQRDLRDWSFRNSDFTRSIEVPRTPKNNTVLLPFVQSGVKDIPGNIEIAGVSLGFDLRFSVNEFTDTFVLNVIFDNQLIFDSIKGQIKDLDFDDLAFEWTQAGVNGIKTSQDIIYAYAHWYGIKSHNEIIGSLSTLWTDDQEIRAAGFFIYLKELFDRIITGAGFTLDITNISGNNLYNNTALPCVVDKFLDPDLTTVSEEEVKTGSQTDYTTSEDRIIFDTVVTAGASYWDNVTDTEFDFTIDSNMSLNAYIRGFIIDSDFTATVFVQPSIRLRRNTTTLFEYKVNPTFTLSISEHIYAENSDEIYLDIYWEDGNNDGVTILADSWLKISSFNQDTSIDVANYVPEISQAELVKGVLNHTNLILSSQQNTIVLYDFSKVFEGYYVVELMNDRPKVEKFTFDNLFKLSVIKYKDPPEPLLRTDINSKFRVNDESLADEGVILELPFEASDIIPVNYNGNSQVPLLDAYEVSIIDGTGLTCTATQSTFSITSTQVVSFKTFDWIMDTTNGQIRRILSKDSDITGTIVGTWATTVSNNAFKIVTVKKKRRPLKVVFLQLVSEFSDGADFDVFNETNVSPQTLASGYRASFGENMLIGSIMGDRYSSLIESMKFPKVVQVWAKIDKADFLPTGEDNLLYKSFYIKKLNERYWVNRLDQWDPETGICRAELVRLR